MREDERFASDVAVNVPSTVTSRVPGVGMHSNWSQMEDSRVIVAGAMVAALRSRSMLLPSSTSLVQPNSWMELMNSPVVTLKVSIKVP